MKQSTSPALITPVCTLYKATCLSNQSIGERAVTDMWQGQKRNGNYISTNRFHVSIIIQNRFYNTPEKEKLIASITEFKYSTQDYQKKRLLILKSRFHRRFHRYHKRQSNLKGCWSIQTMHATCYISYTRKETDELFYL